MSTWVSQGPYTHHSHTKQPSDLPLLSHLLPLSICVPALPHPPVVFASTPALTGQTPRLAWATQADH